ncbi:hypothetical protein [Pelosinus fermentans]|nr:hypothetical protein [Pelosinus fermentans]
MANADVAAKNIQIFYLIHRVPSQWFVEKVLKFSLQERMFALL